MNWFDSVIIEFSVISVIVYTFKENLQYQMSLATF